MKDFFPQLISQPFMIDIHTVVRSKATAITDCIAVAKEKRKTARIILKEKTVMQKFFFSVEGGKSTFGVYALKSYCRPPQ